MMNKDDKNVLAQIRDVAVVFPRYILFRYLRVFFSEIPDGITSIICDYVATPQSEHLLVLRHCGIVMDYVDSVFMSARFNRRIWSAWRRNQNKDVRISPMTITTPDRFARDHLLIVRLFESAQDALGQMTLVVCGWPEPETFIEFCALSSSLSKIHEALRRTTESAFFSERDV